MKANGRLLKNIAGVRRREEAREVVRGAVRELTIEELHMVRGGMNQFYRPEDKRGKKRSPETL